MTEEKFIKEINKALKKLEVISEYEMAEIDYETLIRILGCYYQRN